MPTFPLLQTGAVTQYPAAFSSSQQVAIVRFLDSSDQRWRSQGRALRSWQIDLSLLSESELSSLGNFFESQMGEYATFVFTDPLSGVVVPNCRVGDGSLTLQYDGPNSGTASLWIVETNG